MKKIIAWCLVFFLLGAIQVTAEDSSTTDPTDNNNTNTIKVELFPSPYQWMAENFAGGGYYFKVTDNNNNPITSGIGIKSESGIKYGGDWSDPNGLYCSDLTGKVTVLYGNLESPPFEIPSPIIAANYEHTIFLKQNGTIWSWGNNEFGQLGDGTQIYSTKPVQVSGLSDVLAIAASDFHTVALKKDGTVWVWGTNSAGQFGNGTNNDSNAPLKVIGLTDIKEIEAGAAYTVALKNDGTVWSWGYNEYGKLGDGTTTNSLIPIQVKSINDVKKISAGYSHTAALKSDGTVWTWGKNFNGELGNGTTTDSTIPVQVVGLTGIVAIDMGRSHSLALKNDGTVWAWGGNSAGQLGDGTFTNRRNPIQVKNITNIKAIATGFYFHVAALQHDGTLWTWGENNQGQLGDGTTIKKNIPIQVNIADVQSIAVGANYTIALQYNGRLYSWGDNNAGQLGNGTQTDSNIPVNVYFPPTVITNIPTSITSNSATLNGIVNPNSYDTTYNFEYGTTNNYGISTIKNTMNGNIGNLVTENLTNLVPNTTYYFRLVAVNNIGTTYGSSQTFTTINNGQQIGALSVTISPQDTITAGAQWRVDAGVWQNSGVTVSGLNVGTHTVDFKDVTGWTKPSSQSVTIKSGETATLTVTYIYSPSTFFVTRNLPNFYMPGTKLTVTLTATPASGVSSYAVEDSPPAGWTVSNINEGGFFDSTTNKVKFGPFFDNTAKTLTYEVTPPTAEIDKVSFSGTASSDGTSSTIGGKSDISSSLNHPADNNPIDFSISQDEVTAYGAAWKKGTAWTTPPNPIPSDYITRAGYLWKNGERYDYSPSAGAAPLCWVKYTPKFSQRSNDFADSYVRSMDERNTDVRSATLSTAICAMVTTYSPSTLFTVTITVTPSTDVFSYAVEDVPPQGWAVGIISSSGIFDAANNKVKYGPFFDNTIRTLTYQITPPATATGDYTFAGTASFDGVSIPITGVRAVSSEIQESIFKVLTDSSPYTVLSGYNAKVYGFSAGQNKVTLQIGASAKLINFPGNNVITIQSELSLFKVFRSGATVTFEDSNGTVLTIPATKTRQTIKFNDVTLTLIIENNQVMLENQLEKQEVTLEPKQIF